MKKKYILFIFIAFYYASAFAQVKFNMNGGSLGPGINAQDVKQTFDFGYIVVGTGYLLKTNINGDTVWTKNYSAGLYQLGGSSVCQTIDSGYIDVGGTGIIKMTNLGIPIWSKNFSIFLLSFGCQTPDGGYILAGTTDNVGAGNDDIFLIKTDSAGNPTWSKAYGGTGYDEFSFLQQTSDGGYIIAGGTTSFGGAAYLVKINAGGDTLWSKTYTITSKATGFSSCLQSYDKGYIITGGISGSLYLVKTDSLGNLQWSKSYGDGVSPYEGTSVKQTLDSGFIISGLIYHSSNLNHDVLLMKTDGNGNIIWSNAWASASTDDAQSDPVYPTNDSGYIMAAWYNVRQLGSDFNLLKTDSYGQACGSSNYTPALSSQTLSTTITSVATIITPFSPTATSYSPTMSATAIGWNGCVLNAVDDFSRKANPITVYPNPVAPDGCISINLNEDLKGAEITIYDIMGEVLYSEVANGTGQTILLSLKGRLSSGMYFLRIKQGENVCVQKIVVMG